MTRRVALTASVAAGTVAIVAAFGIHGVSVAPQHGAASSSEPAFAKGGRHASPPPVPNGPVFWDVQTLPLPDRGYLVAAVSGGENGVGFLHLRMPGEATFKVVNPDAPASFTRLALGYSPSDHTVRIVTAQHAPPRLRWWKLELAPEPPVVVPDNEPPSVPSPSLFGAGARSNYDDIEPTAIAIAAPSSAAATLAAVSYYSASNGSGGVWLIPLESAPGKQAWMTVPNGGASRVRFFDVDSDGDLDVVAARARVNAEASMDRGAWGLVWSSGAGVFPSEPAPPFVHQLADRSRLGADPRCVLSVPDFDVTGFARAESEPLDVRFALALSAHLQGDSPNCWGVGTHGGYAVMTDDQGRFVSEPLPTGAPARPEENQRMAAAVVFYDRPSSGVGIAASFWKGSYTGDDSHVACPAERPCGAPTLLYSVGSGAPNAPPLVKPDGTPEWDDALVQRLAGGSGTPSRGSWVACKPGQAGVTLPTASVSKVLAVYLGSRQELNQNGCLRGQECGKPAESYSLWADSSWVAAPDAYRHECIRVEYEYPTNPQIWAAAINQHTLLTTLQRRK